MKENVNNLQKKMVEEKNGEHLIMVDKHENSHGVMYQNDCNIRRFDDYFYPKVIDGNDHYIVGNDDNDDNETDGKDANDANNISDQINSNSTDYIISILNENKIRRSNIPINICKFSINESLYIKENYFKNKAKPVLPLKIRLKTTNNEYKYSYYYNYKVNRYYENNPK